MLGELTVVAEMVRHSIGAWVDTILFGVGGSTLTGRCWDVAQWAGGNGRKARMATVPSWPAIGIDSGGSRWAMQSGMLAVTTPEAAPAGCDHDAAISWLATDTSGC